MTLAVDVTVRRDDFSVRAAFAVEPGETLALLGPNGSGKSTLVGAIAGLLPPSEGSVLLHGTTLDDRAHAVYVQPERRPIGVVFQELLLFPHLSALENVAFPLRARGIPTTEARDRARRLLERLEVDERAEARPGELSGGEAQRVALARALVPAPTLLLLDEPLSALDASARPRIRDLLRRELRAFDGVRILVTHDPVEASSLADRLVILEHGEVTQVGTPEQVRTAPRTRYAADLVGVNAFVGRLEPFEDGAGLLVTDGGEIVVPWPEWHVAGDVIAIVRPADITLWLQRPSGSARNVIRGTVSSVSVEGDRARIRIESAPSLVAEVTTGSVERLGLHDGVEIWASFKAVEVELSPA
jgi:molybdate transport system ATP-binding protein